MFLIALSLDHIAQSCLHTFYTNIMSLTYYYFAIKNADMLGHSALCGSLQKKKKLLLKVNAGGQI